MKYGTFNFLEGTCFEENINYPGEDIEGSLKRDSISVEACQLHCQNTSGCVAFTWDPHNDHCWVKSAVSSHEDNPYGAISGPAFCTGAAFSF